MWKSETHVTVMSCQRCTPTANDAEWPRCCYDTLHTLLPGPRTADHHHDGDGAAEKEGGGGTVPESFKGFGNVVNLSF